MKTRIHQLLLLVTWDPSLSLPSIFQETSISFRDMIRPTISPSSSCIQGSQAPVLPYLVQPLYYLINIGVLENNATRDFFSQSPYYIYSFPPTERIRRQQARVTFALREEPWLLRWSQLRTLGLLWQNGWWQGRCVRYNRKVGSPSTFSSSYCGILSVVTMSVYSSNETQSKKQVYKQITLFSGFSDTDQEFLPHDCEIL